MIDKKLRNFIEGFRLSKGDDEEREYINKILGELR